jgi:hypothetical protein
MATGCCTGPPAYRTLSVTKNTATEFKEWNDIMQYPVNKFKILVILNYKTDLHDIMCAELPRHCPKLRSEIPPSTRKEENERALKGTGSQDEKFFLEGLQN